MRWNSIKIFHSYFRDLILTYCSLLWNRKTVHSTLRRRVKNLMIFLVDEQSFVDLPASQFWAIRRVCKNKKLFCFDEKRLVFWSLWQLEDTNKLVWSTEVRVPNPLSAGFIYVKFDVKMQTAADCSRFHSAGYGWWFVVFESKSISERLVKRLMFAWSTLDRAAAYSFFTALFSGEIRPVRFGEIYAAGIQRRRLRFGQD